MKTTLTRSVATLATTALLVASPAMAQEQQKNVTVSANLIDPRGEIAFEAVVEPDLGDLARPFSGVCIYRLVDGELSTDTDDCPTSGVATPGEAFVTCPTGFTFFLNGVVGNPSTFSDPINVVVSTSDITGSAQFSNCSPDGATVPLNVQLSVRSDAELGQVQITVPVEMFLD